MDLLLIYVLLLTVV